MSTTVINRLTSQKPLPAEVDVFGLTHPGKVRPSNADHFLIASFYRAMKVHASSIDASNFHLLSTYTRGFLFLVADGVGAFSQAAEGSATAVQAVSEHILEMSEVSLQSDPTREQEVVARVKSFVEKAHELLRGDTRAEKPGSNATTFTMALGIWPRWIVAHVGDSRMYAFRNGELRQLTTDQTMAQAMIEAGAMSKEAAEQSHWKHVLTSALGSPQIEPEITVLDIERGGIVMLCTDGLTRHVSDAEIKERLGQGGTAESICRDLVDQALARGGVDNVTVLVSKAPA